jgi:GxxExxY protein
MMDENQISMIIVDAAIESHRSLGGPGLLERVYADALVMEIRHRGLVVEREKLVPINYKGNVLGTPLRLVLLVGRLVIVECKATSVYNEIFEAQVLTYLRLTNL